MTKDFWYENRHQLEPGLIFRTSNDIIVKLERRVPGDGTKWYVANRHNGGWIHEDDTIEPGELCGEPLPDFPAN